MKKGRNPGGKGEEGQQLWDLVTQGIKAYSPAKKAAPGPVPRRPEAAPPPRHVPPAPRPAAAQKPAGFDKATETRLKRGQLHLEGRLDLHGMTQAEAFDALYRFILASVAQEKRTVLVITGKGLKSEGVLKKRLPLWLEDPALASHIIAVTPAQPKDGGSGAFYLRLRKQK